MTFYLASLEHEVEVNEFQSRTWCHLEGMEFGLPACLAHLILRPASAPVCAHSYFFAPHTRSPGPRHQPLLPEPSENEECWAQFAAWRHPRMDLNLLQLAIVCNHQRLVDYFWQPVFLREEMYRGEESRLVNHPLHLALTINCRCLLRLRSGLDNIRDGLLFEEVEVDLLRGTRQIEASRAASSPAQHQQQCSSPSRAAAAAGAPQEAPLPRPAAARSEMDETGETGEMDETGEMGGALDLIDAMLDSDLRLEEVASMCLPRRGLALPLARRARPDYFAAVVSLVRAKLSGARAARSTVRLLWTTVRRLSRSRMTPELFSQVLVQLGAGQGEQCGQGGQGGLVGEGEMAEETLILACQLVWAVRERPPRGSCQSEIIRRVCRAARAGVPVLRAARFLPLDVLRRAVHELQRRERRTPDEEPHSGRCGVAASQLGRLLSGGTLQDVCVLRILEAVRGDAQSVWARTPLPQPLKEKFLVPFQRLYRRLQGSATQSSRPDGIVFAA